MKIVNEKTDIAGKYRAWVEITDGSVIILKFDKPPKVDTEVYDLAAIYEANVAAELERAPADRLEEIEKTLVELTDEKTKIVEDNPDLGEEKPPIGDVEK